MKNCGHRYFILIILCISLVASFMSVTPAVASEAVKNEINTMPGTSRDDTYSTYLENYKGLASPLINIVIPANSFTSNVGAEVKIHNEYRGRQDVLEWLNENGELEWTIDIPETGMYNISMLYYPVAGKGRPIEFELAIDGKVPFDGSRKFLFSRIWADSSEIKQDNRGNDLRPSQAEAPDWREEDFRDTEGLFNESYKFYLEKGLRTISLKAIREPVAINHIRIFNKESIPAYEKVYKSYPVSLNNLNNYFKKYQAELPYTKSDPVLHPIFDRASPSTEPYHHSKIRLNTIGGVNWKYPGQWITWKIDVPEDGLYKIGMRYRQDSIRGFFTTRKFMINGQVPFKELDAVKFGYGISWQMKVLGDDEPYLFYLTKGTHEICMEVSLGEMAQTLRVVQDAVYTLNYLYRKIIMVTGTNPDPLRDYFLEKEIPGLINSFEDVSGILKEEAERIEQITGQKGSEATLLQQISHQLASMAQKPETISERLVNYRDNISALGAWILRIKEQPLELDYITITSPEYKLPSAEGGIFKRLWHELRSFIASFFEDYNNVGNVFDESKSITVWVGLGRDQAQIIKSMIDDQFTPNTGISVNLSLVQGALLQATLAGKGPDIALNVGRGDPVNFAVRRAVTRLDGFEGFNDVIKRYNDTAMVPYKYGDHYYALPETQSFFMMFYRKDIFKELSIEPPQTWNDLYAIMPAIQRNNMQVGLPYTATDAWSLIGMGMGAQNLFPTLLYQHGGRFYNEDLSRTGFDEPEAIAAFKEWTNFYTQHSFPLLYDFYNRFRTGEMPVGIQHYTLYNLLSVAAPEIRNLWDMIPIPGTVRSDGTIDRSSGASGTACILMDNAKDKDSAWKFLKWWTSAEAQTRYGREQEAIMGPAARYNPANIEAFMNMSWSDREINNLLEQWKQVREIPEVPGGYYTSRNLDNAFRSVIINWDNPREALFLWNKETNKEIDRKRKEFGIK